MHPYFLAFSKDFQVSCPLSSSGELAGQGSGGGCGAWLRLAAETVTTLALITSCLSPAVNKACFVRGKECESHAFLSQSFAEEWCGTA